MLKPLLLFSNTESLRVKYLRDKLISVLSDIASKKVKELTEPPNIRLDDHKQPINTIERIINTIEKIFSITVKFTFKKLFFTRQSFISNLIKV